MSAKQEEMFALIEQKDSSQSVSDFCQAHNIGSASFYYWQKKYRELNSEEQSGFAPVELASVPMGSPVATVQLPGGALITLFLPEALSYIQPFL
jgi:transposase-like protein